MPNHQNKQDELTPIDKARALRKDVAIVLLIIASIVLISFVIGRSMEINELKSDIKDKKEQKVAITKHNDKVEAKRNEQLKDINLEDVSNEADTFNELFFDWDSWSKYDKNMKTLREKFPKVDEGKVTDISGKVVGHGRSPISTYEASYLTTTKEHEIMQFVEQNKEGVSDQSNSLWYIISEYKDGQYDIKYMKRYEEYNVT